MKLLKKMMKAIINQRILNGEMLRLEWEENELLKLSVDGKFPNYNTIFRNYFKDF